MCIVAAVLPATWLYIYTHRPQELRPFCFYCILQPALFVVLKRVFYLGVLSFVLFFRALLAADSANGLSVAAGQWHIGNDLSGLSS
jgi:hypothetical protein